ncbi:hypothetical protein FIBSPDRAFT_881791 [Athelia psychrophila]|uniref:Secreted protein n=1 Tax=Athelia psychrophila TaxID=1759441 RepID=A0A166WD57_9AGAM|nr:hypothetical protein FIBSPDRAFT_881791 [Fibularhizoctonia sp. CBS 109695]
MQVKQTRFQRPWLLARRMVHLSYAIAQLMLAARTDVVAAQTLQPGSSCAVTAREQLDLHSAKGCGCHPTPKTQPYPTVGTPKQPLTGPNPGVNQVLRLPN